LARSFFGGLRTRDDSRASRVKRFQGRQAHAPNQVIGQNWERKYRGTRGFGKWVGKTV